MGHFFIDGLDDHIKLAETLRKEVDLLQSISEAILLALKTGKRIYTLGNGGSAADAQHIAAEFVGRFKRERRPLPAIALTTDSSIMLAIGNDYGFGHVFTRQIEAQVRAGDIVWALSTSGESSNPLKHALSVSPEKREGSSNPSAIIAYAWITPQATGFRKFIRLPII